MRSYSAAAFAQTTSMRLYFPALLLIVPLFAQPRTVPIPHTDYLRFIHADAQTALGFDVPPMVPVIEALIGVESSRNLDAIKEIERVWISVGRASPTESVVLMMGHFERGALFRAMNGKEATCVFLGSQRIMLAGSQAAVEAAIGRLNAPPVKKPGWVARQALQLAAGRDLWLAIEPQAGLRQNVAALDGIRLFSLGAHFGEQVSLDGDIVTDSDARGEKLISELEALKASMVSPDADDEGGGVMVEQSAASTHFSMKVDQIMVPAMGAVLLRPFLSLFGKAAAVQQTQAPPMATVSDDKLQAVKQGMTRAQVVELVGQPHAVTSISGLEIPRETWTFRLASGRKATVRLDNGIVAAGPTL